MESAIDKHLQCPRSLSRRVGEDYVPPFPMYVGRMNKGIQQVVMAYFGVQYLGALKRPQALAALNDIRCSFGLEDGPEHFDLTQYLDESEHMNLFAIAYWRDTDTFHRWLASSEVAAWWDSSERENDGVGYFREIVAPRAEQFETLYPFKEDFPGVGALMEGVSDEIEEHGYWGSMRDRIPVSQTDRMKPGGRLTVDRQDAGGKRVRVTGHDNVALIRSGQDWRETDGKERSLYIREIDPPLRAGMQFLRDNGESLGCYSNRFVQHIDEAGNELEQTFNIGHWRSLDLLERWAESHPTHLRIFTTFFRVANEIDKLKLYHEVSVMDGKHQLYEYINCHPRTGMMRDARPPQA